MEVGSFGVTKEESGPLYVTDLIIPRQECTSVINDLDMDHVHELLQPHLPLPRDGVRTFFCGTGIWIHTHPDIGAQPSSTDEKTFSEMGGDWAIMFILAIGGQTSCRLKVKTAQGMKVEKEIPVCIDWASWPTTANDVLQLVAQWKAEVDERVTKPQYASLFLADNKQPQVFNQTFGYGMEAEEWYDKKKEEREAEMIAFRKEYEIYLREDEFDDQDTDRFYDRVDDYDDSPPCIRSK